MRYRKNNHMGGTKLYKYVMHREKYQKRKEWENRSNKAGGQDITGLILVAIGILVVVLRVMI